MSNERRIPKRSEIPVGDTWAIEDLYPRDDAWEEALLLFKSSGDKIASYAGHLADSPQMLCDYLRLCEETNVLAERLAAYSMRQADVDSRNPHYQDMVGRLMSVAVSLDAAGSFETSEIMAIEESVLNGFYAEVPELERYRRYITELRRRKDHILSPAEEKLLAAAGEMAQTPSNVFGAFSNADLTFPDVIDGDGQSLPLTQSTFIKYQEGDDRILRKNSYDSLYSTLAAFKNTSAAVLNAQMKQLQFFAEARHYPSALEASLDLNNVPVAVYRNLIDAVHQNMDKMHRYVKLRKKMLGVDELHFYDVYAKLVPGVDQHIPFEQATQTVYAALAPLGAEYQAILQEGFDNRWIDVYENEGKRAGAYSCGVSVHPYVMLNYTGTLDSQFVLAHEMGHALHSYLSNRTQNPVDANYVIFVAEVASTCNEALLMQHLLQNTTDRKERMYLLNHFLEQFKGTVYRQAMFAEFEMILGQMIGEGKTLTAELLCSEYARLNRMYFGEEMVIDDAIAVEWSRIPHFYFNYYVFQYATGFSAAIALSRKILREGDSAVQKYLGFLSGGCSKSPIDLLRDAGVDMTGPEPVHQALALFGELLDEMEVLLEA